MTLRVVDSRSIAPQPWRNGGGRTRELLAWPQAGDWRVRISLADIERDGPFSPFPGVQRWFTVIEGAGVVLSFDGCEQRLPPGAAPCRFDGANAPDCRLIDGPTRDLNLMMVDDVNHRQMGEMQAASTGEPWSSTAPWRGLFTAVDGTWRQGDLHYGVGPHTLLWDDDAAGMPWSFQPEAEGQPPGWWLGVAPSADR